MQTFSIWIVFLCIFSCSVSCLRNCGEFDKDKTIKDILKEYAKPLPYETILRKIFDAYDENDTKRMEEMMRLLEMAQTNVTNELETEGSDDSDYSGEKAKFVPDLIRSHGYPVEDHEVVTDDGYILHVHRIPHGTKKPLSNERRPPILIMHGLLDGSNCWIALGPENALAYLLADAGYDVWLGNARGTESSRKHVRMSPNGIHQKDYWSFSWNEIGVYDLPALIDHILDTTNQKQLNYAGFSQGTTSFFVMTSMRPEYNEKILDAHLMSPVAFLKGQRNTLFKALAHFYHPVKAVLDILRIYKITINTKLAAKVVEVACKRSKHTTPTLCKLVLSLLDSNQINCTSLSDIFTNLPAGASTRQCFHYLQQIRNGDFRQFDYENTKTNRRMYGTDTPPSYNLTQITAPINIYYSRHDKIATIENTLKLLPELRSLKSKYLVPISDFNHLDFTYSRYVRQVLYERLIANANKVNGF